MLLCKYHNLGGSGYGVSALDQGDYMRNNDDPFPKVGVAVTEELVIGRLS